MNNNDLTMSKIQHNQINSYLTFKLADEIFAAHVSKVLNILEMVRITKIPNSPPYMRGVINLRGQVLPVIDTRLKFGLSATVTTKDTCIIVMDVNIENEAIQLGALVDSVEEVLEINHANIQPSPRIGKKYKSEFIDGMLEISDQQFVILLNMDKVFSADEVITLREKTDNIQNEQKENNKVEGQKIAD